MCKNGFIEKGTVYDGNPLLETITIDASKLTVCHLLFEGCICYMYHRNEILFIHAFCRCSVMAVKEIYLV